MSDWLTQAVTFAATTMVAYHAFGWLRARIARPVKGPAQQSLSQMFQLDQPLSRAATLRLGQALLDQYQHDETVGLVVVATEPDGMTQHHGSMSVIDALRSAHSILQWATETGTGEFAQRAAAAAEATGVRTVRK